MYHSISSNVIKSQNQLFTYILFKLDILSCNRISASPKWAWLNYHIKTARIKMEKKWKCYPYYGRLKPQKILIQWEGEVSGTRETLNVYSGPREK